MLHWERQGISQVTQVKTDSNATCIVSVYLLFLVNNTISLGCGGGVAVADWDTDWASSWMRRSKCQTSHQANQIGLLPLHSYVATHLLAILLISKTYSSYHSQRIKIESVLFYSHRLTLCVMLLSHWVACMMCCCQNCRMTRVKDWSGIHLPCRYLRII